MLLGFLLSRALRPVMTTFRRLWPCELVRKNERSPRIFGRWRATSPLSTDSRSSLSSVTYHLCGGPKVRLAFEGKVLPDRMGTGSIRRYEGLRLETIVEHGKRRTVGQGSYCEPL